MEESERFLVRRGELNWQKLFRVVEGFSWKRMSGFW